MCTSRDAAFCAQSFHGYLEKGFRSLLPDGAAPSHPGAPPVGLSVSYLLHAGMGATVWWLESGQGYSAEQVAGWLLQLSHAAIRVSVRVPEAPGDWVPPA